MLRVGVIGTGAMGRDHIATLDRHVPQARVTAVHDRSVEAAEKAAAPVGARVVGTAIDLITDDSVDAVLVCSPDPTHLELVLACLQERKPVLCEKPLAQTTDGTAHVVATEVATAPSGRRMVQVGFMRHYDPAFAALRQRIHDGGHGPPVLLHCVHRNPTNATGVTPELVVTNSMVHEIDATRWLLDEEIASVVTRTVRRGGDWRPGDPVLAWLTTTSGAVAEVEVFASAGYGYDVRCEAVGAAGRSAMPEQVVADYQTRFADAYRLELAAWADAAVTGRATGPSAWDGHRATVVATACVESLRSGGPVDVPSEDRPVLYDAPAPEVQP